MSIDSRGQKWHIELQNALSRTMRKLEMRPATFPLPRARCLTHVVSHCSSIMSYLYRLLQDIVYRSQQYDSYVCAGWMCEAQSFVCRRYNNRPKYSSPTVAKALFEIDRTWWSGGVHGGSTLDKAMISPRRINVEQPYTTTMPGRLVGL